MLLKDLDWSPKKPTTWLGYNFQPHPPLNSHDGRGAWECAITNAQQFNQACLHNGIFKTKTKPKYSTWWGSRSFRLSEYIKVLGECDTCEGGMEALCPPLPLLLALGISSIWLFLSWIFCNKLAIVSIVFLSSGSHFRNYQTWNSLNLQLSG